MSEEATTGPDERQYIRHPSDIPIQIELESVVASRTEYLKDISAGGLCFRSRIPLEPGTQIHIRIPLVRPIFECTGTVVWCHERDDHCDIGVKFNPGEPLFRLRMVEQICHIEHYKREAEKQGRKLTCEQAAMEWIAGHADRFPHLPGE